MKENNEEDIEIAKVLTRNGHADTSGVPDREAMEEAWFLAGLSADRKLDAHAALQKVHGKMQEAHHAPGYWLWRVAAAISAVAVATVVLIYSGVFEETEREIQVYETTDSIVDHSLPDGSMVALNKFSNLAWDHEEAGVRNVKLSGEAFFEVRHDPQHPFVVSTADARIEVVGTQFNVKAYPGQPTEVTVKEGKVKTTFLKSGETFLLTAAGQVVENPDDRQAIRQQQVSDANYLAWKTGLLEFREAELPEVVARLEALYQVSISFEKDLSKCKITAKFERRDLDFILKVLEATLKITVEKEGQDYILTGDGCK